MKTVIKNCSINIATKVVTVTGVTSVVKERVALITDVTTNTILYNFADSTVSQITAVGAAQLTLSAVPGSTTNASVIRVDYDTETGDAAFGDSVNATKLVAGTAVIGTVTGTSGAALALDATLTTGTLKAIARGGTKGSTSPADVTSSSAGTNNQTLDTGILDASGNRLPSMDVASRKGFVAVTDGTNTAAVKAANTLPTSSDAALVVGLQSNSVTALGAAPTSGTPPANAVYKGGVGRTSLPAAATPGNLTGILTDVYGRQVVSLVSIRDLIKTKTATMTSASATDLSLTTGATIKNDIIAIWASNVSSTAAQVDIYDNATLVFQFFVPAQDVRGITLTVPWPQLAVNTPWKVALTPAVSSVLISVLYTQNQS